MPPPDAGTNPLSADVNVSNIAVVCVAVKSTGSAEAPVLLPLIVAAFIFASLALVTASLAIVVALLPTGAVTSPVNAARTKDGVASV